MILTDGIIDDLPATCEEIIRGAKQPLSIIIVGIGYADFIKMERLDGDINPLYSERLKEYVSRDIVQFVPFVDVRNDPIMLAKKVLEELPFQLVQYYYKRGIMPNRQSGPSR